LFHTPDYIAAVRALSEGSGGVEPRRYNFGPGDNPVFSGMFTSEARKVGGALLGARLLLEDSCDVAFNVSGGLHHGQPASASGFCVFNDAAVAIRWLLQQGLRVAYVDVDVHHGDGVQDAFYETDQVLTISLHQDGRTLFPGTGFVGEVGRGAGQGYAVNVPLPPHTTEEPYLWAFDEVVPPLLRRFRPDCLVTQLGVDTHYLDPLAQLNLTTRGQAQIFQRIEALAPSHWLALGGGGYNLGVVPRAWALAFAAMAGLNLPRRLPAVYREKYGGLLLHDGEELSWIRDGQSYVRDAVAAVVASVKERHGLD
jgi:acetoin utilization protein AcuC